MLFVRLLVGLLLTATGAPCPIQLSPSRVVVKYGDPVWVNCSSSDPLYSGMGWEATVGGTSLTQSRHLTWSVDALTTWKISPKCYINPSAGSPRKQCSKTLDVVVYTFPESIDIKQEGTPVRSAVLEEGDVLDLKCEVGKIAPKSQVIVKWHSSSSNTFLHASNHHAHTKEPVELISSYDYSAKMDDQIRCEAYLDLRPEGPELSVFSPVFNLSVVDGPHFECSGWEVLRVQEHSMRTLQDLCPVKGNPTPVVKWLKDGRTVNPWVPVTRDYSGQYFIQADGAKSATQQVELVVLHDDVQVTCPVLHHVMEHTSLGQNLPCAVEGFPKAQVSWYKDGEQVELSEPLTRYDAGPYVVVASNMYSSANATVELDVQYEPSAIEELLDVVAELDSDVWLKCSARGNPRPDYTWTNDHRDNIQAIIEDGVSRLLIPNVTVTNEGTYTCHARNLAGNTSRSARVSVKVPPVCEQTDLACGSTCVPKSLICDAVKDCLDGSDEAPELCPTADGEAHECPIRIHPEVLVLEYKSHGQNVTCMPTLATGSGNDMKTKWLDGRGVHGKTWSPDTCKDWDPHPVCSAVFQERTICQKDLNFTLYKMPDSVAIRPEENVSLGEGTLWQLHCDIINVAPAHRLAVRWYHGNETLQPAVRGPLRLADCLPERDANGTCDISAIRTPLNVSSSASVRLYRDLKGAHLRCEVYLELGAGGPQPPPSMMSDPVSVTVHYKPVINTTKLPTVVPLFRGYPEELVCEADGHPPPEIVWIHAADARVSGGNITVTEAGLYTCRASNYLDMVFYKVEVIPKEDYLPLIAGFVAATVVIISVIFLFIYSIYYKNTKMRRYSLKNPKVELQTGHVAHNGWDLQFPMTKLS
ncbi:hemicentin-2-like [Entelurus aequoreus]|uniref:hemicentin-2-like n=1 Tax=Entelurus aequoreus TaxID=161455 RepID=UPI002B1E8B48|nr:hemicentin-2-like [Entelurus aequoreus]XP_061913913.1 hemicentin-2-like [Entelurus aequoreus]